MVSDNESGFTDLKTSLNWLNPRGRISRQNFLIIFQNFNILINIKSKYGNMAQIRGLICMLP